MGDKRCTGKLSYEGVIHCLPHTYINNVSLTCCLKNRFPSVVFKYLSRRSASLFKQYASYNKSLIGNLCFVEMTFPFLCSVIRLLKSPVLPVYKVLFTNLKIYT